MPGISGFNQNNIQIQSNINKAGASGASNASGNNNADANAAKADGKDDIKVKTFLMNIDQFSKLDKDVQKYFVKVG